MIYFLGIGGIGMSALARFYKAKGYAVAGYDRTSTALTKSMEAEGISIHYVDDPSLIPDGIEFVVRTPAVPADTKELVYLREKNVQILKRAQVLGMISREHAGVAVAGSHGKTTTTALVSHILMTAGKHISAFIGGIARNFDSNVVIGDEHDDFVVMEADEYDRSFMQLSPYASIVTSIDADHLDIYGDYEHVVEGFNQFVEKNADNGLVVYHAGLPIKTDKPHITYGFSDADVLAENIRIADGLTEFEVVVASDDKILDNLKSLGTIRMPLYGDHNVQNALAALTVCSFLGVSNEDLKQALLTFKGVKSRFDIRVRNEKHVYIDDFGHHPEEMKATLMTARKVFPDMKMTVVFQPHLFTRTRDFMDEFAAVLSMADRVVLTEIYPARELPIEGVNSEALLDRINLRDKSLCSKSEVVEKLKGLDLELLITLGAGDIHALVPEIEQIFDK
jgi:UDP-N-acetylmuramate--alanine ligase